MNLEFIDVQYMGQAESIEQAERIEQGERIEQAGASKKEM